jgi:hypothetical protein
MNTKSLICLVLVALGAFRCAGTAEGWDRPYYCDYALTSWLWPSGSLYVRDAIPPYFALFPPVYYSYAVPRTYGFSPYAYPPGTITPASRQIAPLVVRNEYLSGTTAAAEPGPQQRPPLRIVNPFVAQPAVPPPPAQP